MRPRPIERRTVLLFPILAICLSSAPTLSAFELRTHGELARGAVDASLNLRSYLDDTGLAAADVLAPTIRTPARQLADFENAGTPSDWVIEGVIREDDYQLRPLLVQLGCQPPKNPPSLIDRPVNHFFDVQRGGRGLTVPLVQSLPAPDWALGLQGRGASPTQNQFSVLDARTYQLKSLTEPSRQERERNAALLFRSLGQTIHLLQDMAQPQHTRNDPHAGCLDPVGGEHSWFEDYMETRALGARFRSRGGQPLPLPLAGYAPPAFTTYRDYFTQPTAQGLADFSSRNFFSAGTNLSLVGECGGLPEPPCRADAYTRLDQRFSFLTVDDKTVQGTVTLHLRTIQDPVTGDVLQGVPLTSRSLWDQHLEERGLIPVFTLNTLNYDAMGSVLLPRAVGYSAGFLDYFFRGRLDVDLVETPDTPDAIRVETINASSEPMGEGILAIYTEDRDGGRTRVGAPVPVSGAAPGGSLPGVTLGASDQVTRVVAVYTGALGRETRGPSGDPPGAVVGRVIETPAVEEVFSDGVRWQLRTPRGVFPLPILAGDVEDLRWGDVDNTLVGRSAMGPGARNQFSAYRLRRSAGAREVPLRPADAAGVSFVDLETIKTATFPDGLDTGTVVDFDGSSRVTHDLLTFEARQSIFFDRFQGDYFAVPTIDTSDGAVEEASDLQVTRMLDETLALHPVFAARLSLDKYESPQRPSPYQWAIRQIGLDRENRILALVEVMLTSPENNERTVAVNIRDRNTGALRPYFLTTPRVVFPIFTLLFATIDVGAASVVASTGAPTFSPVMHTTEAYTVIQKHVTGVAHDGPLQGETLDFWDLVFPVPPDDLPGPADILEGGASVTESGLTAYDLSNWYRPEVAAQVMTPVSVVSETDVSPLVYAVVRPAGSSADQPPLFRTFTRHDTTFGPEGIPTLLRQAIRLRPASDPDHLLLFGRPHGFVIGESGVLLSWSARRGVATRALPSELPPGDRHHLAGATTQQALVLSTDFTGPSSRLIALQKQTAIEFPGDDLTARFVVLDPGYLYSVEDLRFHRPEPSLRPTALPARLADVPGNPVGDYHLVQSH